MVAWAGKLKVFYIRALFPNMRRDGLLRLLISRMDLEAAMAASIESKSFTTTRNSHWAVAMRGSCHHPRLKGLQNACELRIRVADSTRASKIALAVLALLLLVACTEPVGERPTATPSPSLSLTPDAVSAPLVSAPNSPTPSPAPDREPHDYRVEDVDYSTVAKTPKFHEVEFTARIVNHGGSEGPVPIAVEASLDGGEHETVKVINRAIAGADADLIVTRRLRPGAHRFELAAGESVESISLEVAAADLAVNIGPFLKTERSGWVKVPVMISNRGDATAEYVQTFGTWQPAPLLGATFDTEVGTLAPGATTTVEFEVRPAAFPERQRFYIIAGSRSLESDPADNSAERVFTIFLDYLAIDVSQLPGITYVKQRAQTRFRFLVENSGEIPSGEFWAGFFDRDVVGSISELSEAIKGLPQCAAELSSGCWRGTKSTSVNAGERRFIDVVVPLVPGTHSLIAFVGGPGYRGPLQGNMISELKVVVPPQPPVAILADLQANVRGYWSDGTANVELSGTVTNVGSQALRDPILISLACQSSGIIVPGCEGTFTITLANGFGPNPLPLPTLNVPMGSELEIELEIGDLARRSILVAVPERILGVDRHIWECFQERGSSSTSYFSERCSGMFQPVINKWDQSKPVKIWATGRSDYRPWIHSAVEEYFPLLGLDHEFVENESEADLRAYIGVPKSMAEEIGLNCTTAYGCANWDTNAEGVTYAGRIVVWSQDIELPRPAVAHELLHAMVPIYHRHTPGSFMNFRISRGNRALLALNAHPLVKPGMSMAQVRELIVLNDELLDPRGPDNYELIWRVGRVLTTSEAYRHRVRFRTCGGAFSEWGTLEADTTGGGERRWDVGETKFRWDSGDSWHWSEGAWHKQEDDVGWTLAAGWWNIADAWEVLRKAIRWGELEAGANSNALEPLTVTARSDGRVTISTTIGDYVGSHTIDLTVDETTFELLAYRVTVKPGTSACPVEVEAVDGQYWIRLQPWTGFD